MQPTLQSLAGRVIRHDIKFGPVAGGQKHGFLDAVDIPDIPQRVRDFLAVKHDLLANFDRCRVMVQPEYF